MTQEELRAIAAALAEKILRMDHHSAQLRLVHIGALREGELDEARLITIRHHFTEIVEALEDAMPLAARLTPTFTPATAPEKQPEQ